MTRSWRIFPALGAAALGLSACVGATSNSTGQRNEGPFLYQNRGVAHAPAVKQVDAASYNAVIGDRYWPQPGEFFYFKQVGVMVGNNGFRASRDGGAFWVTFGHNPDADDTGSVFSTDSIQHSEVVAIPPGQTRTYTAGEAVMSITTPSDIAREDEILVVVERGAAPMEDFGDGPNQAYAPPAQDQSYGYQPSSHSGYTPQYGAPPSGYGARQTANSPAAYGAWNAPAGD